MKFNTEQSVNPMIGETVSSRDLLAQPFGRVQRRSPHRTAPHVEEELHGIWDELTPSGVEFRLLVQGQPKALNPAAQQQICLIVRESLHNALQHSGATAVETDVEYSLRRLRVIVRDNGRGIDPQAVHSGRNLHCGLPGMRERAGSVGAQLRIWSRLGAGTEVEISIPIQNVADALPQFSRANIASGAHPHWRNASPAAM